MNMLHIVMAQQTKCIPAQNNVIAYVIAALGSTEFIYPPPKTSNLILHDQLFDEFKTVLI
jgi:hypothetical protein